MINPEGNAVVLTSPRPAWWLTLFRLLTGLVATYYVFSRFIPCHPVEDYNFYMPVDNAWALILHEACHEHLQFGKDIVFSYGPWGFLGRGYLPSTFAVSMAAWLALSTVFILAAWRVARAFTTSHVLTWVWLIAYTAFASIPLGMDLNTRIIAWILLLLWLHFFGGDGRFSPLHAALTGAIAWLGLVKFTGMVEGGFLVAVIALDTLIRRRCFPWVLVAWLAGVVAFWLLARQPPGDLWPYLNNSWELARGYADAMQLGGLSWMDASVYFCLAGGCCGLALCLLCPPRWPAAPGLLAGLGGILFLTFKESYIRDDYPHEITAPIVFLLLSSSFLAAAFTRGKGMVIAAGTLFCVTLAFASFLPGRPMRQHELLPQVMETFCARDLLAPVINLTTSDLRVKHESMLAQVRALQPLPAGSGTSDLYNCRQDVLFANNRDYCPRPVIQSYSAYTARLARMNAEWLRTDRAAQNLYFTPDGYDGRLPALDDGLSWPEILTRYDLREVSGVPQQYLWFTRSSHPRSARLEFLLETNLVAQKTFVLPVTNGLVWAEIGIKKTSSGKVLSWIYKPAVLAVDLKLAGGKSHVCTVVPALTGAGFLLSPFVADPESFAALAKGDEALLAPQKVLTLIVFEPGNNGQSICYQPDITIRLYRLVLSPDPAKRFGG
ncbi:MAG TPA: hypothetical protein VNX46_06490 [Candidatus Acidoferrum sp.]|jgi:hypothetical protein|nr:hypothetical protein [Candidatus Acidoferrum sp.]